MKVYNITEKDINKFTAISKDSTDFKKTVQTLWKNGLSVAQWCFVIEEKGEIIGRVGYWAPLDDKKDIRIFELFLPGERDNLQFIGQKLLNESLKEMKKQGARSVNYQLHLDKSKNATLNKQILELIGMEQVQAKKSFKISNELYEGNINNRLTYTSLEEVEEDFFIEIIKEVTKDTLDQEDKLSVLTLGELESAKNYFSTLKSIDYSPKNWFIGYKGNNIIGLVVPQKLKENLGTINYIGVIPEKRGQGYVIDLLDKGIKNLFNRNVKEIIADIDETNFPMENALLKIGFKEKKRILVYSLTL